MELLFDVLPDSHALDALDIARTRPERDSIEYMGSLILSFRDCGSSDRNFVLAQSERDVADFFHRSRAVDSSAP